MSINELENVDGARTGAGGIDSTPAHTAMLKTETEGKRERGRKWLSTIHVFLSTFKVFNLAAVQLFLYRFWIRIISMDVGQANMKGGLMK